MLEVFRQVDPYINIIDVWASDGKRTRAEPVAALFEPNSRRELLFQARLVGFHEKLEEELTTWRGPAVTPEGRPLPAEPSPNMLDAMVWALSELMLGGRFLESELQDERHRGRR